LLGLVIDRIDVGSMDMRIALNVGLVAERPDFAEVVEEGVFVAPQDWLPG